MPKRKPGQKAKVKPVIKVDDGYPRMNILTPIYNRTKWLPLMVANIMTFDYDKEKLVWYILDSKDGDEDIRLFPDTPEGNKLQDDVRKAIHPVNLIYEYWGKKMTIAEKRNHLVKHSTTKWWANMDSDDIYLPTYLQYSLDMLLKNKVGLCGSPQMLFIYPNHDYKTSFINCPANRQIHEATMCFTRKHFRRMGGFSKIGNGEGSKMVDGCNEKQFYKTEVDKQMICICHQDNTCKKDKFLADRFLVDAKITGRQMELLRELFS